MTTTDPRSSSASRDGGILFSSILVISTRQLGDVLLTTPLIHAARERWPDARIDVLGFKGTLALLRGNPDVNELIEVPAGAGWKQSLPLIRRLWKTYDLALIAQYSDRAHLYGLIAARRRSGLILRKLSTSWWKRATLVHHVVVDHDQTHAVIEKMRLLEPWADIGPVSVRPPAATALPPSIGQALAGRYVVVQVPSLVRYKQWPVKFASTLVGSLSADGWQVVLTGSASESDRSRVAEVVEGVTGATALPAGPSGTRQHGESIDSGKPAVLDVSGRLDLNQVTTLLQGAALYVGPDTSITHLAAACGTPTIALFGPVSPTLWGPWPQGAPAVQPYVPAALRQSKGTMTVLQGTPPCVPCNRAGCDNHNDSRSVCLETMLPERVLAEARSLLASVPAD